MKDFREVIADYLEGKANKKSKLLLDSWISRDQNNELSLQQIFNKLQQSAKNAETYNPNTQKAYDEIVLKIKSKNSSKSTFADFSYNTPTFRNIAAVVAFLLLAISSYFIYFQNTSTGDWITLTSTNSNKDIVLGDGTHVWLNEGSILKYPASFSGDTRNVVLSGEAFFEVKEENEKPFIIQTVANSVVEVKGTSLNIRCYEEEKEEEIAVLSGSVTYKCPVNSRPEISLKQGQCAMWDMYSDNVKTMEETDPNIFTWKDNILKFDNVDCHKLEKAIERYFHIEVLIKDPDLYNCSISAFFHNKSLNEVLSYLKENEDIHADVTKDTCFLWGKICKDDCD